MANVNISSPPTGDPSDLEIEKCDYIKEFLWRREYLAQDTYKHSVALASVNFIAFFPTVLLNALVIFAVATRRPLRTNSNILLAGLAGADMLTGLIVMPIAFAVEMKRILDIGPFCALEKAYAVASMVAGSTSLSHLVLIGVNRYIAIKKPLRYQNIVTKKRLKTTLLLTWAITVCLIIEEIVLASLDSKREIYSMYLKVGAIAVSIIGFSYVAAIAFCYGYIFSEARRQIKRLQTEQLLQEELQRIKKDKKAANTLAIILAALVLTYLPALVSVLVTASSDRTIKPPFMSVLWNWVKTSLLLGSLCNPIIYCWRMKELRKAFLEILHLRQPENTPPEIEMQVIQGHRPQVPPTISDALSRAVVKQEPVLLSFRYLQADEIVPIDEADNTGYACIK